jgi:hypothetical protein
VAGPVHGVYHFRYAKDGGNYLLLGIVIASAAASARQAYSQLRSIAVRRPNVVVRGSHLYKVEIWAIPTGTGITPDEYVLLGNAQRNNAAGAKEIWIFLILPCATDTRLLATDIFARALNAKGAVIGTKSLSFSGASAVHEALCGKQ